MGCLEELKDFERAFDENMMPYQYAVKKLLAKLDSYIKEFESVRKVNYPS